MTRASIRHFLIVLILAVGAPLAAQATDAVTRWTVLADRLGGGIPNWRTLAIMQMAMHDALNAAQPTYARWAPPLPDEPSASGASPEAALAASAEQVLLELHPQAKKEITAEFQRATQALPPGPATDEGLELGRAIGAAWVQRRAADGNQQMRFLPHSDVPGRWRGVPPDFQIGATTDIVPFLFASREDSQAVPPPELGGPRYLRDVAEIRAIGGKISTERTKEQTYAATYWASQSSQRGFVLLGVSLLDAKPRPGGLAEHARIMSRLTAAMADSAILSWVEKERFSYWRPITAIQSGGFGVVADPAWEPLLPTPPHPDYPSGHAADCFTGAGILSDAFGPELGPITYVAQSGMPEVYAAAIIGMGQHLLVGGLGPVERKFPSLAAAAEECLLSRIWAGAHFRAADDEAKRLAGLIVARALTAVPTLTVSP